MALGDYANSRGAADMGLLPDRLPGYAYLDNKVGRGIAGKALGRASCQPSRASRRRKWWKRRKRESSRRFTSWARIRSRISARSGSGRGKLQLLIVHEMFLTETAQQADIVFPAASAYEKDGSVTNTSGEIQLLHKAG